MICESGRVISIDGNTVWVETHQMSSCQSCSAKAGCGQRLLSSVFGGKRHYVKVAGNALIDSVKVHDEVEIAIPEHVVLKGTFWLYLLPLAFLILGAAIGNGWTVENNDVHSMMGAGFGLILACLFLRWHSIRYEADPEYQPVLHRIIRSGSANAIPLVISSQ